MIKPWDKLNQSDVTSSMKILLQPIHTYIIKMNRYTNIYLSLQNSQGKPQGSAVLLAGNVTVINVANY